MPNQEGSPDGKPGVDRDRPSADVDQYATDGQSNARGKGATDEHGDQPPAGAGQRESAPRTAESSLERRAEAYEGDGPAKVGLTSDRQPDLVAPSGVNEGDRGAADVPPTAAEMLNFDDDDEHRPRGNTARTGGTYAAQGGDSGALSGEGERRGPGAGLSDRNGPSDPDAKNERPVG